METRTPRQDGVRKREVKSKRNFHWVRICVWAFRSDIDSDWSQLETVVSRFRLFNCFTSCAHKHRQKQFRCWQQLFSSPKNTTVGDAQVQVARMCHTRSVEITNLFAYRLTASTELRRDINALDKRLTQVWRLKARNVSLLCSIRDS